MSKQTRTIGMRIAVVISLLIVLSGINKVHLSPFNTSVKFDYLNAISWADNACVAVDQHGKRILITNRNLKLTHVVDMTAKGSPVDKVIDARVAGDKIYVLGCSTYDQGVYLSDEKVLVYNLNGKYIEEKYKAEYKKSDYVTKCRFSSIEIEDDKMKLVSVDGNSISSISIDNTSSESETAGAGSASDSKTEVSADGSGDAKTNASAGNNTVRTWTLNNDEVINDAIYFKETKTLVIYARSGNIYAVSDADEVGLSVNTAITGSEGSAAGTDSTAGAGVGGEPVLVSKEDLALMLREYLDYRLSMEIINRMADVFYAPTVANDSKDRPQYLAMLGEDFSSAYLVFRNLGEINKITGFNYSFGYAVWTIAFWLAVIYLAAELVVAAIRFAKKRRGTNAKTATIAIGLTLLVSIFYTYQSTVDLRSQFEQSVMSEAKQYSIILGDEWVEQNGEMAEAIREDGLDKYCSSVSNQRRITEFQNLIKKLCSANGNDYPVYAYIFLLNNEGELVNFVDSENNLITGDVYVYSEELLKELNTAEDEVHRAEVRSTTAVYAARYFNDSDGQHIGVALVGCYEDNIIRNQITKGVNLFVTLTTLLILVYVLINTIRTFSQDFKRRKARGKDELTQKSIDLTGAYGFLQSIVTGTDTVILVFVAQALCADMSGALKTAMIAVPFMAQNTGSWLGSLVYSPTVKKFGERKVTVTAAVVAIASLAAMVASINIKSLALFSFAKLIYGTVARGFLYMAGQILPINSRDEEAKHQAINSTQTARMGAGIISLLIGGYVSQYLSYKVVYIITAVLMLGLLALLFLIFNNDTMLVLRNNREAEERSENKHNKSEWKLYLTGPMLSFVLLFILAKTITGGYGSYLFPLYSAHCGLTVVLLSNLMVFSRSLTYVLGDEIDRVCKKMKTEQVLTRSMLIISGALVCFLISSNIYWAIAVLFLIDIMTRANFSSTAMYVYKLAGELGYDEKEAVANYYTVDNAISIFQSPILTAFLALGYSYACAAVGVVTGIMVGLFSRIDSRRRKNK